ncbi:hypothetical protein [Reinekea blandensis]|uniref:TrbL/VirB6 plasmid conjugal transfer protein n=1 Tax=Reinekea blandensis MED297 TaxID=314283 RepID=A4BJX6_9GAMM|nr:hypothetical protein [Reinekea blandensis]EAR07577.1 hypothetical protein MED297_00110 [Reinekea sp. MED297] [Reinekea blandensis MED297]
MIAENSAQLWFLVREALSPDYLYQYAFQGAVGMSVLAPVLFGLSIAMRSGTSLFASLKGDTGDVRKAWLQLIVVAFAYGLYLTLGYAFLSIVVDVWRSFGSFSNGSRSIEAIFFDAFAHAEQQDSSLWDMAKEGASFFIFIGAEIFRIGYTMISMFLSYAHAILFAVLFMTGPIVIPLSMIKQFDFTKGWATGWKVVIFWPIFEVMLRTLTQIPFMEVASVIENSTASGGSMKIIIFTSMIIIYGLAGAIAVMVPFFTNALVTGAGIVASAVAPMVGGAIAATGMLGSAMKQGATSGGGALKSAAGAAVPASAAALASSINQQGPSILKNTVANSQFGKQMGQLGKDLKASVAPVTKPLAGATKATADAVGRGVGLDTEQVASDIKSLSTNSGTDVKSPSGGKKQSSSRPSPRTSGSTSRPAKAAAMSTATSSIAEPDGESSMTSKTSEVSKASDTAQEMSKPKPKPKPKSKAAAQAKRGAIVNQVKKAKKD